MYILLLYNRLLHIEAVLQKHWFFILGHEALHILKFVGKVSTICICIFSFDIIISRDIRVRNLVVIFSISSDWIFICAWYCWLVCQFADLYIWALILPWNSIVGHMLDSFSSQLYPCIICNDKRIDTFIKWHLLLFLKLTLWLFLTCLVITPDIYWSSKVCMLYLLIQGLFDREIDFFHNIEIVILLVCEPFPFSCRAANVFSCAYLVNLVRPAHRQIPVKHQKALWYSGKKSRNC